MFENISHAQLIGNMTEHVCLINGFPQIKLTALKVFAPLIVLWALGLELWPEQPQDIMQRCSKL